LGKDSLLNNDILPHYAQTETIQTWNWAKIYPSSPKLFSQVFCHSEEKWLTQPLKNSSFNKHAHLNNEQETISYIFLTLCLVNCPN
jgi:hypothetical protein